MSVSLERLARNQVLFREVNEPRAWVMDLEFAARRVWGVATRDALFPKRFQRS
jgi:hypothetical protein